MEKEQSKRLLQLIAKKSETAFQQFYELHVSFILQIAYQILKDMREAEDVTHEVFIEVYENPHAYQPIRGSVRAWLAVKTKSRSIDRLRQKRPILVHKLEQLDTADSVRTELSVLLQIEREILFEALQQIPEKQREVIYGAYFEGKTQTELAQSLNRPLGTIKSLVRYGLRNMRKQKSLLHWMKIR